MQGEMTVVLVSVAAVSVSSCAFVELCALHRVSAYMMG